MNGQKKEPFPLGKAIELLEKYKYVLLVILIGSAFLLWPQKDAASIPLVDTTSKQAPEESFDLAQLERKMSIVLSQVEGAGEVSVLLSVKNSSRNILAEDKTATFQTEKREQSAEIVVVSSGSGSQSPVLVEQIYPEFQGALVVCSGGDEVDVHWKLVEAVSALTGLGADKICICKGK